MRPRGVYEPAKPGDEQWLPDDEYDCIRDPMLSRLLRGDDRSEFAAFLRQELEDHFGMPTWARHDDADRRIFDWWEAVR